jgi:hypothetical protein
MYDEVAGIDPSAHSAAGDAEILRDLGDGEEGDLIVPVTATRKPAGGNRFPIATARGHAWPRGA